MVPPLALLGSDGSVLDEAQHMSHAEQQRSRELHDFQRTSILSPAGGRSPRHHEQRAVEVRVGGLRAVVAASSLANSGDTTFS